MLRTRAVEVSLWEAVLPPEVLRLPEELARVDALLDDPAFFVPFVPRHRSPVLRVMPAPRHAATVPTPLANSSQYLASTSS